ncbi:hypothetical protein [Azospirillum picis]|uniref:Uncharacterized protein n=1 Tax=Azospirillum picis TaxID=488438 RepID=A0ABU0MK29_9PROT|nr:hypothetical protein [Azospirillum picis]MBP2299959.1 hypothetical protein [Azospirillum picis]MDQ0533803.1 hypothetical protein [Azospirillum picis]
MSLLSIWSSAVLEAARLEPVSAPPPRVPEPRHFRLPYNPLGRPGEVGRRRPPASEPLFRDPLFLEK